MSADSDERRWCELGKAIERACAELPDGFDLCLDLERGAGSLRLYLPGTDATEDEFNGDDLTDRINNAVSMAIDRATTQTESEKT